MKLQDVGPPAHASGNPRSSAQPAVAALQSQSGFVTQYNQPQFPQGKRHLFERLVGIFGVLWRGLQRGSVEGSFALEGY